MNVPNFHDGYFDGLWMGPNKLVHLFLRTVDEKPFTLVLQGVERLTLSEVKEGNIILDLVARDSKGMTLSDIKELYGVDADKPQATNLLNAAKERGFQLLEINPSYGAAGLALFQTFELIQGVSQS
jgi:hypothetical protein